MKNKMLCIIIFLLLISTSSFGQSSFQGITPGTSTRDDAARVLGQPVRTVSATRFEYRPPAGIARVEVEFGAGSSVVERLEVYFLKPISRSALIKQLGLSQQADARKTDAEGSLIEYFGGSSLLGLTYASGDVGSGVSRIGYCSREMFERESGIRQNIPQAQATYSSWEKLDMCETAWERYCDTWVRQGDSWRGWGVPLKITVNGNSVRVDRSDRTGLRATYMGTISGNRIQGTVDFCCDGLGNRRGTWEATIRRE